MVQRMSAARRRAAGKVLLAACAVILAILLIGRWVRARNADVIPAGTNEERISFLASQGWEVESVPISEQTIRLPETFPDVLLDYNQMQKQQGFDLEKYAGKEIRMFSYAVKGSSADGETQCSLYVYKNRVIGGDVHSTAFDGYMVPLR